MNNELTQKLIRFAKNITEERLETLADRFSSVTTPPTENAIQEWALVTERAKDLQEIARLWTLDPTISGEAIAYFLQGAWHSWRKSDQDQEIHMLLTGPQTTHSTIRSIEMAILKVINASRQRLLLVTFASYPSRELLEVLQNAETRGVHIELAFENPEDSGGKLSRTNISKFTDVLEQVTVYHWPRNKRDPTGTGAAPTLHAKFVLADDEQIVVSSANLTEFAFDKNIELGVIITGGDQPKSVRRYYDELIREGHLEKYTSSTTD